VTVQRSSARYVVGIDFGTLSGRAVVVDSRDGAELGSAVYDYPHAVMDHTLAATGAELPPQWALQDPEDYVAVLREAVPGAVAVSGIAPEQVVGIATDFTASTPMPVLRDGTPLCRLPELEDRPHAYPKLWKHHAAQRHADRINELAEERGEPWLARYGGRISSEWQFAKALQVLEEDPEIYELMDRWIEAADWIVWRLCGEETRNTCTAGYKAIYQDGRYPSEAYLRALEPRFADVVPAKIEGPLLALGSRAGGLTPQAARWTGLPAGIAVAAGNVDAHVTAPAAQAIDPGQMLAVMGTSTCHMVNGVAPAPVPGMCGVVEGGIVPGLWGYEAGQSGVGDIFGWFVERGVPPEYHDEARRRGLDVHGLLSELAAEQEVGQSGLIALDWHNGNRSVLVDHELSGLILGLTLGTRPEHIYRALIEATAFGTRKIIETFEASGVPVREFFVAGGLLKNAVIMQIYADVIRRPLHLIDSAQGPALGSTMHAAVAAGVHPDIHAASEAMGRVTRDVYSPDDARADGYDTLYEHYSALHDHFGRGGDDVMRDLRRRRPRELARD
jgi:L-ribulokinase